MAGIAVRRDAIVMGLNMYLKAAIWRRGGTRQAKMGRQFAHQALAKAYENDNEINNRHKGVINNNWRNRETDGRHRKQSCCPAW